jgi:hypothetical protein
VITVGSIAAGAPGKPQTTESGGREEAIIFVHLPKCGGTTLNRLIEWEYNPLRVFSIDPSFFRWSYSRLTRTPVKRLARIQVFQGHMPFGLHKLLGRPCQYITVLREPTQREISSYYYARSRRLNPQHGMAMRMSLEEFVRAQPNTNMQTKMLSGLSRDYDFLGGQCTPEMLAAAKRNLAGNFTLVGLTERFDELLALAKILFGWKVRHLADFNVTGGRPKKNDFAAAARYLIAERDRYDMELYDYTAGLFDRILERYADAVRTEVENLGQARTLTSFESLYYRCASAARKAISRANSALLTL